MNPASGGGKGGDFAVCQEVFPSTFPWGEFCFGEAGGQAAAVGEQRGGLHTDHPLSSKDQY